MAALDQQGAVAREPNAPAKRGDLIAGLQPSCRRPGMVPALPDLCRPHPTERLGMGHGEVIIGEARLLDGQQIAADGGFFLDALELKEHSEGGFFSGRSGLDGRLGGGHGEVIACQALQRRDRADEGGFFVSCHGLRRGDCGKDRHRLAGISVDQSHLQSGIGERPASQKLSITANL